MSCSSFNKFLSLYFFLAFGILFISPISKLFQYIYEMPWQSFTDILAQPLEIKRLIKKIATFGVLLLLLFFVSAYLVVISMFVKKLRIFACGMVFFLVIGGSGYFFKAQQKVELLESNHSFMTVDATFDSVSIKIKFKEFPVNFYQDLLACAQGEMKLSLNQRLYSDIDEKIKVTWSNKAFPKTTLVSLTQEDVEKFLKEKELIFKIQGKQVCLDLRDLKGSPLSLREDTLYINDKKVILLYDKAFFVAFYIESLDGRIRKVYV